MSEARQYACSEHPPRRLPPHAFFIVSAIFHYLGPSFAVLLFAQVEPLGVAWLRIASAALIFALWRRPWRMLAVARPRTLAADRGLGATLAAMNVAFYLAIDRLPLATVASIEFVATIARGARRRAQPPQSRSRSLVVARRRLRAGRVRGHGRCRRARCSRCSMRRSSRSTSCSATRLAREPDGSAVDRLGAAMLVALVFVAPVGLARRVGGIRQPDAAPCRNRRRASPPRSSPMSATSSRWRGCRARPSRSCWRCCRRRRRSSARSCSGRFPPRSSLLGIALVAIGIALHKPG